MEQWMNSCGNRRPFVRDARLLLRSRGIAVAEQVPVEVSMAHGIPRNAGHEHVIPAMKASVTSVNALTRDIFPDKSLREAMSSQ